MICSSKISAYLFAACGILVLSLHDAAWTAIGGNLPRMSSVLKSTTKRQHKGE